MSETDVTRKASALGDWVARVGVPSVIAFILLFQVNQKLDLLTSAVTRLVVVVESKAK